MTTQVTAAEIMVVDDTATNLNLLIKILTDEGYKVRPANSGELALASVSAKVPDLILLDIKMHGIDGYEVCRILKANEKTSNIPVIFISALDDVSDKVKGFSAGGVDFINKPFQPEEVLVRVKTHIEISQLREKLALLAIELELKNERLQEEIEEKTHTEILIKNKNKEIEAQNEELKQINEELKEAKEKVELSEDKYHYLYENAPVGIYRTKIDGSKVLEINDTACEILGFTKEELLGHPSAIRWADLNRRNEILKIMNEFGVATNFDADILKKDGSIISCLLSMKIYKEKGFIEGFIVDISDRKKNENIILEKTEEIEAQNEEYIQINEELSEAKERAEENDRLKSSFLANMSHEIRTPMNSIIGYSEFLLEGNISADEQQEFATIVNNSAKRLLTLITNVMDISKIESGQMQVKINNFNINYLFKEIYNTNKYAAENKQLSLSYNLGLTDENAEIKSYEFAFYQILTNLLTNAFKYTTQGSVVFGYTLRHTSILRQAQDSVAKAQGTVKSVIEFYVKDTGIGISKEYMPKIFNRFSQEVETMSRKYEGAGLGLSIVKGLVDLIQGEISIEAEQGKGTCITVRIPCFKNENIPASKNIILDYNSLHGACILIVEDDEASFRLLKKQALRVAEIKILHAANGLSAIEQVKKNPDITCVLMDLHLPDMDGLEATRNIKQINRSLPVIAVTAAVMQSDRDKAFNSGCDAFFSKPVDIKKLLALMAKYHHDN